MKKQLLDTAFLSLSMSVLLSGCNHKDLIYDDRVEDVQVVFDWEKAPNANPKSMVAYFYDEDGTSTRFIFSGRDGGVIDIPEGNFCALGMNSDVTDWAKLRNVSYPDGFETYTADAYATEAYGLSTRALPRVQGTEHERVALAPGMLWSDRCDNVQIKYFAEHQTVTFYPEEAVCHYSVDVTDVTNLEYIDRTEIDGIISGMAEGYMHGSNIPADEKVTMPFTLSAKSETKSLHGEFLTFGEPGHESGKHILTIYLFMRDGSKWYYPFDVTTQVHNAPDPKHVHIVLKGLSLPKPIMSGGGVIPQVNNWQTEEINLRM